jgi:hypothetical protein
MNRVIWNKIYPSLVPDPGFDRYIYLLGETKVFINRTDTYGHGRFGGRYVRYGQADFQQCLVHTFPPPNPFPPPSTPFPPPSNPSPQPTTTTTTSTFWEKYGIIIGISAGVVLLIFCTLVVGRNKEKVRTFFRNRKENFMRKRNKNTYII